MLRSHTNFLRFLVLFSFFPFTATSVIILITVLFFVVFKVVMRMQHVLTIIIDFDIQAHPDRNNEMFF